MSPRAHDGSGATGTRGIAVLVLAATTIAAWWPLLGAGVLLATPMAALAVWIAAAGIPPRRSAAGRLVAAVPLVWAITMLLVAVPSAVVPTALPGAIGQLGNDLAAGARDGVEPGGLSRALVAWLLLVGIAWTAGARRASGRRAGAKALGFVLFTAPLLLVSVAGPEAGSKAWLGIGGLIGALLWATRGRLGAALPAAAGIAAIALIGTLVIDVGEPWQGVGRDGRAVPGSPLATLAAEQTYAPMRSAGSGRAMLDITAPRPGLWRMQTLEHFDGVRWGVSSESLRQLPQPSAQLTTATVAVIGLRDRRAAGDGRVAAVTGVGTTTSGLGEATEFVRVPTRDEVYTTTTEVVRPTLLELATVDRPTRPQYPEYTRVGRLADGLNAPAISLTKSGQPALTSTALGQTLLLAARLADGATTQLELVRRVDAYLRSGSFRYELAVQRPGPMPLQEFLLQTKEGYCQHFAGAGAMLLRMMGVPTRVVAGFATGRPNGTRYRVRDLDAHAWIEVYCPGHGWVPFDMTPADAAATVIAGADPFGNGDRVDADGRASALSSVELSPLLLAIGLGGPLLVLAVALALRWWQASPSLEEALAGLVPGARETPSLTLSRLTDELQAIGPRTSALAREAEQQRFGREAAGETSHVRRRVWRALRRDVGTWRALRIAVGAWSASAGPAGVPGDAHRGSGHGG